MKRIPQLDSIRGMAVLAVLLHNTDITKATGLIGREGWMGVDLFFALSGFLITSLLLDTKGTDGYFRNFYARRCLRIWPLYYSALLFMFVVVPILRPPEAVRIFGEQSMPWWSYPIYLQNFLVRAITRAAGLLGVTWSLAVEEQFYLVWPLVVRYCSEAKLRIVTLSIIGLGPVLRFYLVQHHVNVYPNTFCRLDGLMAGALLAILFRSPMFRRENYLRLAWVTFFVALPIGVFAFHHAIWAAFSFTAMASAALLYLGLRSTQKWLQALLSSRFLIYTGTISYGIYLLEKIPIDAAQLLHLDRHPVIVLLVTAAATYLLATLSWNMLEKPCLRLKRFFESSRRERTRVEPMLANAA